MDEPMNNGENKVLRNDKGQLMPGSAPLNPTGKPPGVVDRAKTVKAAIFDAFEKTGGVEGLIEWVNSSMRNRRDFYHMMIALMPKESAMDLKAEFTRPYVVMPSITKNGQEVKFNIGEKPEGAVYEDYNEGRGERQLIDRRI